MKKKFIEAHMRVAYVYAKLSYCKRRQAGCVIVKDNSIIAIGYNGTPTGEENQCEDENGDTKPNVIHAEDNALRKLIKRSESSEGSSVFVTTAPCKQCAVRLVEAGISELYYTEIYRKSDGLEYLKKHNIYVQQIHLEQKQGEY